MKKKLLSLVLAGAMVASTSVSAFAATEPTPTTTTTTTMSEIENQKDIDVSITGDILDNNGNVKPGTINVTVPTAVNFTVTKTGALIAGEMVITNNSSKEKVKVSVKEFKDPNADKDINIVKKSELADPGTVERNKVWLNLTGKGVSVGFESANKGKMYDPSNESEIRDLKEIGSIDANGGKMELQLQGGGGTSNSDGSTQPISDNFNLVLRIERDRQQ